VPISSLGVGSGLQAEQIIASLMAVERRPLQALQNQEKDIKTKVSSFGQLQSLFSDLQTSSRDLGSLMLWKQTKATCSDPAAIAVASSNGAAPGTYNVGVTNLAEAQTISSRAYSDSNAQLSAGKLTIELGQWTGEPVSGFEPKPGSGPISITIGNNDSSLAKVRDKINNANAGVTASIVRDANGARLSIVAKDTGASNAFKVSVVEDIDDGDASTGLSGLAFDRTSSDSPMTLNQAARNAVATINGISISSASNTLENVAEGLTLSLLSKSASSVAISVAQDTDAVKAGIESFVKSFNAIASYFKSQTKYDAGSKNAGPLQGDRTAITLQGRLRAVLNEASSASQKFWRLSDVGLVMKRDGTLETKSSKLADALSGAHLEELRKMLTAETDQVSSSGFMVRYRKLAATVTGSDGALTTITNSLNAQVKRLGKREDAINDRLASTEARLRKQYEALDTQMAKLSGLSNYVGSQLRLLG
jgi:flagellar hook-associated protein 2